jgi:hypothetical protein
MNRFTNLHQIDISMAVWLVHDDYDFLPRERAISATALLKPTRQIILAGRVTGEALEDISARISMRLGHAIHDSIEHAWKTGYKRSLSLLGLPDKVIDRFKINPDPKEVQPEDIPVYIEQRGYRKLGEWVISGKLDMAVNGRLKDAKSTSVFSFIKGNKDENYRLQLSFYKWLHSDKVTDDEGDIQFVFTDWQKSMVNTIPGYPPIRIVNHTVSLYSEQETETLIASKIEDLVRYQDASQDALPRCTDEELWRSEPVYKYYSDPTKTDGRATKNFDSLIEANNHLTEKRKGVVKTVPGQVKACLYCRAFDICEQRKEYTFDD